MIKLEQQILEKLAQREADSSLRNLGADKKNVDFYSNDYLGFARCPALRSAVLELAASDQRYALGSTGSRLISGNDHFTELLEADIASFHRSASALIFNSGYDANVGLFSSIAQRGDTIIADELAHASIIDGARLSNAFRYTFRHNDMNSLESKLRASKGNIIIAVESVYSMDGDHAPLADIIGLANSFGASVIVDEAHAIGIFGEQGRGVVCELGLENNIFARVVTFGKALGTHGAAVLASSDLRNYLINFSRPFIYSTAASPLNHLMIKLAYDKLKKGNYTGVIRQKVGLFKDLISEHHSHFLPSASPIQSLIIPGNRNAREAASSLVNEGLNVKAILHPTVPAGRERLRICLHTFNTGDELTRLTQLLHNFI